MVPSRLRGLLLAAAAACAPGRAAGAASSSFPCPDCNIILIAVDTLRPDHLGCYGYSRPTSPNIDRLAGRGTVFDDFIVQAYLTPISMASMLTSRYPSANGFMSFSGRLDRSLKTLPEILRGRGYLTAAFPTSAEFFVQMKIPGKRGGPIDMPRTFQRGFSRFMPSGDRDVPGRWVFDWLEQSKDRKFFLWLPLGSVHWPYAGKAPDRIKKRFDPPGYAGPLHAGDFYDEMGLVYKGLYYPQIDVSSGGPRREPVPLTDKDREFLIGRYDAGIAYTDDFVGRLEETLRRLKLDEKTVVILLSDHAEDLGEHGYYTHYDVYNTELRGALIVKHPKLAAAAARVPALVSGLDVAPTILDIAGIPAPSGAQGRSLAELVEGRARNGDAAVFSERIPPWESVLYGVTELSDLKSFPVLVGGFAHEMAKAMAGTKASWSWDIAVQTQDWKLIHRRTRRLLSEISWWGYLTGRRPVIPEYELYRLGNDPTEQENVFGRYPKEFASLRARLAAFENDPERQRRERRPPPPSTYLIPYP